MYVHMETHPDKHSFILKYFYYYYFLIKYKNKTFNINYRKCREVDRGNILNILPDITILLILTLSEFQLQ